MTGVEKPLFAKKIDLVRLKLDIDKLHNDKFKTFLSNLESTENKIDNDQLKTVPVALKNLRDVLQHETVKLSISYKF